MIDLAGATERITGNETTLMDPDRKFESISTLAEHEQAVRYALDIKKILNYLVDERQISLKRIADICMIQQNNLSQFLSRSSPKSRASNIILKLYRFLLQLDISYISNDYEIFALWNNIIDSRKIISDENTIIFRRIISYMDSSLNRINRACSSYNGFFCVYRFSIISGRVVKTRLSIRPADDAEKMWLFDHEYKDALGGVRKSSGALMTLLGNIYCIGKIASGFGFEIIVFREPNEDFQKLTQALVMSLDTKNQPICARAVIRYCGESLDEEFGNFDLDKIGDEIAPFKEWMENPSSSDRAIGLNLL